MRKESLEGVPENLGKNWSSVTSSQLQEVTVEPTLALVLSEWKCLEVNEGAGGGSWKQPLVCPLSAVTRAAVEDPDVCEHVCPQPPLAHISWEHIKCLLLLKWLLNEYEKHNKHRKNSHLPACPGR